MKTIIRTLTLLMLVSGVGACTGGDGDDYPVATDEFSGATSSAQTGAGSGSSTIGDAGVNDALPVHDGQVLDGNLPILDAFSGSNSFGDAHF